MAAGEDGNEDLVQHVLLANDGLAHLVAPETLSAETLWSAIDTALGNLTPLPRKLDLDGRNVIASELAKLASAV